MNRELELKNCSSCKGALMLLIVLYHSLAAFGPEPWGPRPSAEAPVLGLAALWLNSFPVYGFTLISGYLFAYIRQERGGYPRYLAFLANKARRLLLPCLFFSLAWAGPVYALLFGTEELAVRFLLGVSPNQLWFLWMLFWVFAFFWPLSGLASRRPVAVGLGICLLFGLGLGAPKYYNLNTGLQFMLYFYLGFLIRRWDLGNRLLYRIPSLAYLAVHLALFGLVQLLEAREGTLFWLLGSGCKVGLYSVGAVGSFVLLQRLVCRLPGQGLAFFARHSMTVYLVHQQIIYITLLLFSGRVPPAVLAALNFTVSLGLSLGISLLLEKSKLTRLLTGGK